MSWMNAMMTRLRLLLRRDAAESRMRDEFGFHIEMESARLMREEGLGAVEARRRALIAFGGVERYGEELRDGRGGAWLGGLSLDLRLGLRMLMKYPGLAIVGGIGMAVAIAIATVSFGMIYSMMDPALPVPGGDRIVMLQNFDTRLSNPNRTAHLHDLETWREELESVEDLGAFRTVRRNLLAVDDVAELVQVAEMSAAGFALTRVPPLFGRPLLASDERPGAAEVVVIGEGEWRNRFGSHPDILGRSIRLGASAYTIVGVMPGDYRFPVNHQYWIPLRLRAADFPRGAAPSVEVFGRLAEGATLEQARAEVRTVGNRLESVYPGVYETLRPQLVPYTYPFFDVDEPGTAWAFHLIQLLITLLLVVVGVNVAVLMYARTTTRLGEITVRTALGASRRRIVLQLFAEALVLASAAAALGVTIGGLVLHRLGELLRNRFGDELPFWLDPGLTPGLIAYVAGLAVLAALVVGAAPALKATGRHIQAGLRSLGSGTSALPLGRTWTALIVAQVALAVAVLPAAVQSALQAARLASTDMGYPAAEYLRADVSMERQDVAPEDADRKAREHAQRFAHATSQLIARLEADAGVADVTFAIDAPGDERWLRIEATAAAGDVTVHHVVYNRIAPDFFEAFDVPLLAGRDLTTADASGGASTVVVNRAFVEQVLGGGEALGRTVRYTAAGYERDPDLMKDLVFEIAGVVPDFPTDHRAQEPSPRLYRALAMGQANPMTLIVRTRDADASGYARTLRQLATETSLALGVDDAIAIDDSRRAWQGVNRMIALGVLLGTLSVVSLSAAGIYAMTSFAVVRRRREVGIRAALGAPPAQLLRAMFARTAAQLTVGIAVGIGLAAVLDFGIEGKYGSLLPAVAALMLAVGLIAASVPARRGLRIQPTEALREE